MSGPWLHSKCSPSAVWFKVDISGVKGYNYGIMKIGFELKLGIGIVVVFGLLIAGMAVYPQFIFKYYTARLESENPEARVTAFDYLAITANGGHRAINDFCRRHTDLGWGKQNGPLMLRIYAESQPLPSMQKEGFNLLGLDGDVLMFEILYVSDEESILKIACRQYEIIEYCTKHPDNKQQTWICNPINPQFRVRMSAGGRIATFMPSGVLSERGIGIFFLSCIFTSRLEDDTGNVVMELPEIESNKICIAVVPEID